jgi:hypothetical protein
VAPPTDHRRPLAWEEWYRLARAALACRHEEAVVYANVRVVEERNRHALRAREPGRSVSPARISPETPVG